MSHAALRRLLCSRGLGFARAGRALARKLLAPSGNDVALVEKRFIGYGMSLGSMVGATLLLRQQGPPTYLQEQIPSASVSAADEVHVHAATKDAISVLIRSFDAEERWWDEKREFQVRAGDVSYQVAVYAKKLEGFSTRIFMGVTTFDATVDELVQVMTGREGCRKERWEPAIESFQQLADFKSVLQDVEVSGVLRTKTKPVLMGLIPAREFDDFTVPFHRMRNETRWLELAISLRMDTIADHLRQTSFAHLLDTPPSPGSISGLNFGSGLLIEPSAAGNFRCKVKYVLHSDPQGGIPLWLVDRQIPQTIKEFVAGAHRDLQDLRRAHGG